VINRGGNRYLQTLPPDEGLPAVHRPCFDTHQLSGDWRRHFYWHPHHGLQDILRGEYWREVLGNLSPGDRISCELGQLGERLHVDLAVLGIGHRSIEMAIISRHKETPVAAEELAAVEPRAKSRRVA
jgi:hypothetical protein